MLAANATRAKALTFLENISAGLKPAPRTKSPGLPPALIAATVRLSGHKNNLLFLSRS